MRVIHLASSAEGGAGIAARRTVTALRSHGVEAQLWTADRSGDEGFRSSWWGQWRSRIDRMALRVYPKKKLFSVWSNNFLPSKILKRVDEAKPDLIHLHLIGPGVLDVTEFRRLRAPLVWSMHDAWAFTGGCHYPGDCRNYTQGCGACPQLGSNEQDDLSRRNIIRKRAHYNNVSAWISPSRWLYDLALQSKAVPLSRLHCIPYGLDQAIFSPEGRAEIRRNWGIGDDELALAVGATYMGEARKGFHLVPSALKKIAAQRKCVVLQFGSGEVENAEGWPCPVRRIGVCKTEREISALYKAADVCLIPSLQDNLPNVALEALSCGCPIVGFIPSGLSDIIEDGTTGKVTAVRTSEGLAIALNQWLYAAPTRPIVSANCRAASESSYSMKIHGAAMANLYARLLAEPKRDSTRTLESVVLT